MSKLTRVTRTAMAATTAITLSGALAAAEAETLRFALGTPLDSDIGRGLVNYAEAVKERTNGELEIEIYPMTLLNYLESMPGVRDGIADGAYILAPYHAAEFPHYSLLADKNLTLNLGEDTGKKNLAFAGAITEYAFNECPGCMQDYANQNMVYMGGATSSIYLLLCNKPVRNQEELQGKRIRAGSPSFGRFANHFGATGIQMAANEVYEALSQGVLDCAMLSAPELQNNSLHDVVTDVTLDVPGGVYAGANVANLNRDTWQGLTDDKRAALLWGSSIGAADITWNYHERAQEALDAAEEMGIAVHEPDPALVDALKEWVQADQEVIVEVYKTDYGIENAEEILADFQPYIDRWNDLVADVETREEYRQLTWDEIFSKIDPSTYAMD